MVVSAERAVDILMIPQWQMLAKSKKYSTAMVKQYGFRLHLFANAVFATLMTHGHAQRAKATCV